MWDRPPPGPARRRASQRKYRGLRSWSNQQIANPRGHRHARCAGLGRAVHTQQHETTLVRRLCGAPSASSCQPLLVGQTPDRRSAPTAGSRQSRSRCHIGIRSRGRRLDSRAVRAHEECPQPHVRSGIGGRRSADPVHLLCERRRVLHNVAQPDGNDDHRRGRHYRETAPGSWPPPRVS